MSSFLKQGRRQSLANKKKNTRKHVEHFYKRLHELDLVAQAMIKSGIGITPDNVIEEAAKYTDQEIDSMSKNILLSKVSQVYEELGVEVNKTDEKDTLQ